MNELFIKSLFIFGCVYQSATFRQNNEVYPSKKDPSPKPNSASSGKSDDFNELRDFFMNNVEDHQICHVPGLKELIIKKDGSGVGWWSRRCSAMSSRALQNADNKPTNKMSKQLSSKIQEKLNNLLKKAKCQPVRQMIDITNLTSSDVSLIPCRVHVKRCSGCCNSDVLQCVPTDIRDRRFNVLKLERKALVKRSTRRTRYSLPRESSMLVLVKIPEHRNCECQCKEKPTDCTARQEYHPHICQCICPESLSRHCPKGTIWSDKECSCSCLSRKGCTTGMVFNEESCTCEFENNWRISDYNNI